MDPELRSEDPAPERTKRHGLGLNIWSEERERDRVCQVERRERELESAREKEVAG